MNKTIFRLRTPRIFYNKPIDLKKMGIPGRIIMLIKDSETSEISVKIGDKIKSGRKIGISEGRPVFSTITGRIKAISQLEWINNEHYSSIEIEQSGNEEWEQLFAPVQDLSAASREDILSGLESAGYPLNIFKTDGLDKVIINCFEEDVLTSNVQALIIEKSGLFTNSVALVKKLTNCEVVVAVQTGFEGKLAEIYKGEIKTVKPIYPSGMDEILPRYLKEDNIGIIRADLLINMLETLKTGRPAYEKIITLIGEGNRPIKNLQLRIGTPVSEILNNESITLNDGYKIILGGAMRGRAVFNSDFSVQNDTNGLMIQGTDDIIDLTPKACLNCGECVRACPQKLQVNMLARYSEFSLFEKCESLNISDCIECGMCAYVCTSHRPLVQYLQFTKTQLLKKEASDKGN